MSAANDSFGKLVRAEWTKLRSVRRWKLGLVLGLILTVLFAALIGSGSSTNVNDFPDAAAAGDDDIVRNSLVGVVFGLVAVSALAVLFMTAEYKQGMMIRTTLAASPRRGRVLAAKAIVIGAVAFAVGLVGSAAAFLIAQPLLRNNGYEPPGYPYLSLSDGPVLRAVVGTALVVALLAGFSLGLAAIFRRSTGAITLVVLVVVLPQILGPALPEAAARFLGRMTPVAGFAVQHTRERFDTVLDPWAGLGVLAAWTAATLLLATLLLRSRDA
jgi:ABC-type transport system involved in multi-copper enzyme maturation permease subunit